MASVAAGARSWDSAGWEVLPRGFFARPVLTVAPELLGCVLVHRTAEGLVAVRLTEVEAYDGAVDPASHAFRGQTARNSVMFGAPGHAYVYFTYGMHFCVNLVCGPAGAASAVLLRAGRVVEGTGLAAVRRTGTAGSGRGGSAPTRERDLARGPARLCQAAGIDRRLNGADACDPVSPLRVLAPSGAGEWPAGQVGRGPRVGVSQGAEVDWRFWIAGDPTVSAYRPHVQRRGAAGHRLLPGGADQRPAKSAITPDPADGSMHR